MKIEINERNLFDAYHKQGSRQHRPCEERDGLLQSARPMWVKKGKIWNKKPMVKYINSIQQAQFLLTCTRILVLGFFLWTVSVIFFQAALRSSPKSIGASGNDEAPVGVNEEHCDEQKQNPKVSENRTRVLYITQYHSQKRMLGVMVQRRGKRRWVELKKKDPPGKSIPLHSTMIYSQPPAARSPKTSDMVIGC